MIKKKSPTKIVVIKIGGSCLPDGRSFTKIISNVRETTKEKETFYSPAYAIVVLSAFKGLTNTLERAFEKAWERREFPREQRQKTAFNLMISTHASVYEKYIANLYSYTNPEQKLLLPEIEKFVKRYFEDNLEPRFLFDASENEEKIRAKIISFGEKATVAITREILFKIFGFDSTYLDAKKIIETAPSENHTFIDQDVNMEKLQNKLKVIIPHFIAEKRPIFVEGFIGANEDGATTLLPRDGSDITAAAIARALALEGYEVPCVKFYKDVRGVFENWEKRDEEDHLPFMGYKRLKQIVNGNAVKILHPGVIDILSRKTKKDLDIQSEIAEFKTGIVGTRIG